ncbi:hypothetical protein Q4I30_005803 [Leishmania utingensis]|uniref:Uncharacterized protein n=1 Tax=Leishmania utingensis TaxID=653362 RepID=A0AAW3A4J0_9TRYP
MPDEWSVQRRCFTADLQMPHADPYLEAASSHHHAACSVCAYQTGTSWSGPTPVTTAPKGKAVSLGDCSSITMRIASRYFLRDGTQALTTTVSGVQGLPTPMQRHQWCTREI